MTLPKSSVLFKSYDPIDGVVSLIHNISDNCFVTLLKFDDELDHQLSDKYVTEDLEFGFELSRITDSLWTDIVEMLKVVSCWQVRVEYNHIHAIRYFLYFKTLDEALLAKLSFE